MCKTLWEERQQHTSSSSLVTLFSYSGKLWIPVINQAAPRALLHREQMMSACCLSLLIALAPNSLEQHRLMLAATLRKVTHTPTSTDLSSGIQRQKKWMKSVGSSCSAGEPRLPVVQLQVVSPRWASCVCWLWTEARCPSVSFCQGSWHSESPSPRQPIHRTGSHSHSKGCSIVSRMWDRWLTQRVFLHLAFDLRHALMLSLVWMGWECRFIQTTVKFVCRCELPSFITMEQECPDAVWILLQLDNATTDMEPSGCSSVRSNISSEEHWVVSPFLL